MGDTEKGLFEGYRISPWTLMWGLSPAVLFVVSGSTLDIGHMHPESQDFPTEQVDLLFTIVLLIVFTWSLWFVRKLNASIAARIALVVPVMIGVFYINVFVAFAGCSVVAAVVGGP